MSKLNISNIDLKYLNFTIKEFKSQGYTYYRIQKQLDKNNKVNVTGKSKEEVKEKYFNKLERFLNNGITNLDTKKMTFAEFVHYYLFEIVLPSGSIKPKSFNCYNNIYRKHIEDNPIGKIKLTELKKEQLQKYFNNLCKANFKISTIKAIKTFISTVLNYATNEDYITKNYCTSVKLPKNDTAKKNKFLTDDEVQLIFKNCKDLKLLIIIKIALSTGMRINEILALTENDFNFDDCSIKVNKTLSHCSIFEDDKNYKTQTIITAPKSTSSNRTVYFSPNIANDIKKYITLQKERYLKLGKKYTKDSIIFTNKDFDYVGYRNLTYHLGVLFKKCNISASGFHIFRHTSGSKLYEMGVNIKTISEQLGHSNTNITSNIYVHLDEEKKKEAIKYLDKYFESV